MLQGKEEIDPAVSAIRGPSKLIYNLQPIGRLVVVGRRRPGLY